MAFQLVYLSQQDPQWKNDLLGFGDPGDTLGMYGCALTSVAMLLSGHGYSETPKTLNEKMKSANGFVSSGIRWDVISKVHPQVMLKEQIMCENTDAPLGKIDAALAAGQPVVVRVDSSPAPGLQWHYVLVYARKGSDYLMLDPYPYQPGTAKEDLLMARYSRGNPLQRSIQQILIYQCSTSGGTISTPASSTPTTGTAPGTGPRARVMTTVTSGLNVRSSTDTSSMANLVVNVPAGTELALTEPNAESKIGVNGQWVRVRTAQGQEGFAAAWFLEKVAGAAPAPVTKPVASPVNQAPASSSGSRARVMATVTAGLNVRSSTDTSSMANLVANVPAGTELALTEPNAKSKIGVNGQWVRVRTAQGQEGFAAAWFLEKVAGAAPAPVTESAPSPVNEAPVPASTNPAPVNEPAANSSCCLTIHNQD